mmetsp:Transcript_14978/g.45841  ORF Transcript_14978/g.45841 Transcript_14978/m.45841 type:complete len:265 (-) Transcript_14978:260-1054(-)
MRPLRLGNAPQLRNADVLCTIAMAVGDRLLHSSALAIVPPEGSAWEPIQEVRHCLRDAGLCRWPPHINLVYPFVEPLYYRQFAERARPVLEGVPPFHVSLDEFGTFGTEKRGVVWLRPRVVPTADGTSDVLQDLHARLCEAVPNMHRWKRPFVPHLTVTHTRSHEEAALIAADLQRDWAPVTFPVETLCVLSRQSAVHAFELSWQLPLGDAATEPSPVGLRFASMPRVEDVPWAAERRRQLQHKLRAEAVRRQRVRECDAQTDA